MPMFEPQPLTDVAAIKTSFVDVLCSLFLADPPEESNGNIIFEIFSIGRRLLFDHLADQVDIEIQRGLGSALAAHPDMARTIEKTFNARLRASIGALELSELAHSLVYSKDRPDAQICGQDQLELLVHDETPLNAEMRRAAHPLSVSQELDGRNVEFCVAAPSAALLMRCAIRRVGLQKLDIFDRDRLNEHILGLAESTGPTNEPLAVTDLVRVMARPELLSLRVSTDSASDVDDLERWATAFRTRIAYEASTVYAPVIEVQHPFDVLAQPTVVRQLGPLSASGIFDVPGARVFGQIDEVDEELSLRYLRALSAREPFSAFMGFYHILEYFMEASWIEKVVENVQSLHGVAIVVRSGSTVMDVAREANAVLTTKVRFTEIEAIKAVVERRVDVSRLQRDLLLQFGDVAVAYFANTVPEFSDVAPIIFAATGVADTLATRIYGIRNAITHSKESRKRYNPYRHDRQLAAEVPLTRFVAEQLLIKAQHWL